MEPFPVRADAERLAAVSAEQAARFGDVLRSAGFAAAAGNLPMEVEGRARGGRNIPRVMRLTAAGRPLDIFVRLFLVLKIHGEWKDCFLYAVLREEWESKERTAGP